MKDAIGAGGGGGRDGVYASARIHLVAVCGGIPPSCGWAMLGSAKFVLLTVWGGLPFNSSFECIQNVPLEISADPGYTSANAALSADHALSNVSRPGY